MQTRKRLLYFIFTTCFMTIITYYFTITNSTLISAHYHTQSVCIVLPNQNKTYSHHVYYQVEKWSHDRESTKECVQYDNELITSFAEIGQYWNVACPRKINSHASPVLYGTFSAQKIIWDHQHPKNCTGAKYVILSHFSVGVGASLHVASAGFAQAIDIGRIMLWHPMYERQWTHGNYCSDSDRSWNCFFLPTSHCTPTPEQLSNIRDWDGTPDDPNPVVIMTLQQQDKSVIRIPLVVLPIVQCSPIPSQFHYYWWRTQAITFMIRPNKKTLEKIAELKLLNFPPDVIWDVRVRKQDTYAVTDKRRAEAVHMIDGEGMVSLHVRHGDKHKEMKLVDFSKYLMAAEKLLIEQPLLKREIFLSTEDPLVIEQAKNTTDWKIYFSNEVRKNDNLDGLIAGGDSRLLHDLLNLDLALRCDARVGTLASNWNRLIDELASTVGYCAGCPYVDVGQGCSTIKECLDIGKWLDTGWK